MKNVLKDQVIPFDILRDPAEDVRTISELPRNIKGIIHLAAISRVAVAEDNPHDCIETNFWGLYNILNLLKDHPNKPWLIFASSREVYGESKLLPVKEFWPKIPVQLYGVVKLAGENLCEAYSKRYDMKIRIVRFSNAYTSKYDQMKRVIPTFILNALQNKPICINGDGTETFDFTYISEVGRAMKLLLKEIDTSKQRINDFNIVSGKPVNLQELAEQIRYRTRSKSQIVYSQGRNYDVNNFYGDGTKTDDFLHFHHTCLLSSGLNRSILELKKYLHENN
jgi:nucleoside-diphosphate-sugar epimerase